MLGFKKYFDLLKIFFETIQGRDIDHNLNQSQINPIAINLIVIVFLDIPISSKTGIICEET